MVLTVASADAITLKIDPSLVLVSRQYVDDTMTEHEKSRRHPVASLTDSGLIQLSSVTDSSSETQAATPLAIKIVRKDAESRVKKTGDTLSGELNNTAMVNYRIKAGNRAFFLRFDGNDFYITKTAVDADG